MTKTDFTILGGGAMGTAMACLLSNNSKNNVTLWLRNRDKVSEINAYGENIEYLPGKRIPPNVKITNDFMESISSSKQIVLAVPSNAISGVLTQLSYADVSEKYFLSVIKGFDHDTGERVSEIVTRYLKISPSNYAALSGPNFAAELVSNIPSTMVIASSDITTTDLFKNSLRSTNIIVYQTTDVVGVEISSILKNTIAIMMGIVDGLGFGANTKGAVFSLCMKEALDISTKIYGAQVETIFGPACLGDAITTGFSSKSRNYLLGLLLAKKVTCISDISFLCEGKNNIKLIRNSALEHGIEAPAIDCIYEIIEGANAYRSFSGFWNALVSNGFDNKFK